MSAIISDCGIYRYFLAREWNGTYNNRVAFIMLNPSIADANVDDPTVRKCIGFAQRWGYDGLGIYNLFALRATNPKELRTHRNPVGVENDEYLRNLYRHKGFRTVVVAWGNHGTLYGRDRTVLYHLQGLGTNLQCLGFNSNGTPKHPLMLSYKTPLRPYTYL